MPKRKDEEYHTVSGETPTGERWGLGGQPYQPKRAKKPSRTRSVRFWPHTWEMGVIRRACKVAEVGRQTHYDWMEASPEYRRAFEAEQEDAADNLEAEVYRRAVKGVKKSVGWYKGVAGGQVREYSDVLLMFQLKALRPEKYRERAEVAVTSSVANNIDIASLPDEAVARIAAGESIMTVLVSMLDRGLASLQPYLKKPPLALPPTASTEDGGDAAGPPHPVVQERASNAAGALGGVLNN